MTVAQALNERTKNRLRGHGLFTKAICDSMPAMYSGEDTPTPEKVVRLKFFGGGRWAWLAFEAAAVYEDGTQVCLRDADPERVDDVLFFGYCVSGLGKDCDEVCYWTLSQLAEAEFPPLGLPVERDCYFDPAPLGDVLLNGHYGYTQDDREVSGR